MATAGSLFPQQNCPAVAVDPQDVAGADRLGRPRDIDDAQVLRTPAPRPRRATSEFATELGDDPRRHEEEGRPADVRSCARRGSRPRSEAHPSRLRAGARAPVPRRRRRSPAGPRKTSPPGRGEDHERRGQRPLKVAEGSGRARIPSELGPAGSDQRASSTLRSPQCRDGYLVDRQEDAPRTAGQSRPRLDEPAPVGLEAAGSRGGASRRSASRRGFPQHPEHAASPTPACSPRSRADRYARATRCRKMVCSKNAELRHQSGHLSIPPAPSPAPQIVPSISTAHRSEGLPEASSSTGRGSRASIEASTALPRARRGPRRARESSGAPASSGPRGPRRARSSTRARSPRADASGSRQCAGPATCADADTRGRRSRRPGCRWSATATKALRVERGDALQHGLEGEMGAERARCARHHDGPGSLEAALDVAQPARDAVVREDGEIEGALARATRFSAKRLERLPRRRRAGAARATGGRP